MMNNVVSKVGLFSQDITLNLSDNKYLIEKVKLPKIVREKVNINVMPGTIAVWNHLEFKGQLKSTCQIFGSNEMDQFIYLVPDKLFDSITLHFFGGQHQLSISSLPAARAKYAIVGIATVEITDYKELVNYFKDSMTRDELVEEIDNALRQHLSNEVNVAVSRFITPETTELNIASVLNEVAKEVVKSNKTKMLLNNMGLILSSKGISMHLNPIDDTEEKVKTINDKLTDKAIASLDDDLRNRDADDLAVARKHELDMLLAKNTTTTNSNINVNKSGSGNVTINNKNASGNTDKKHRDKRSCNYCGKKIIGEEAKFCTYCGKGIE